MGAVLSRFILQKSTQLQGGWVLTDTLNGIVVTFLQHRFNETQKFTMLEDKELPPDVLAKAMTEVGDWISFNHYFLAMPEPDNAREKLAILIRLAIKERGLTHAEVAERADMTEATVRKICAAKFNVNIDVIDKILQALSKRLNLEDL